MGKGNTYGYGASKYGASKYHEGYREGMKDGYDTISKLFKAPFEGGYRKEELCNIFDIKPGNLKRETIVSKIINDYDVFDISCKLDDYEETHICRSCIHKCVCKLEPIRSMYGPKEWCDHFYNYHKLEKQEDYNYWKMGEKI